MRLFLTRRLLPVFAPLAVQIWSPPSAWGQCPYREAVFGYLSATYEASAMQVRLDLEDGLWYPGTARGNAVAFDIFRTKLGYQCGPVERVTDQPIPWPTECDSFVVTLTDPNVSLDTAYAYDARPVDANRNPAQGENVEQIRGYGVVGSVIVAHGQPFLGDNFNTIISSCPDECMAGGIFYIPDFSWSQYWGTTVTVRCHSADVMYYSNGWVPRFECTSVSPSTCLVALESIDWGAVKHLYR